MQNLKFKREEILSIVKGNRDRHQKVFEEAIEGYRLEVIAALEHNLELARQGKRIVRSVSLVEPVNQTREYNRVVRMFELCVEPEITLNESDFASYVLDQWHWQQQFASSNRRYIKSFDNATYLASLPNQEEGE